MQRQLGLGLLIAAALAAPRARAHGPAPAVLEVLSTDAEGPTWLRATVGLLRRNADGTWAHVCPSLWDGNDRMQAAVASDTPLVLSADAYLGAADRCDPWTPLTDVEQVAADPAEGRLYWVAGDPPRLHTTGGELGAVPSIGPLTSLLAADGRVAVVGRRGVAIWDGAFTTIALPDRLRYGRALTAGALHGVAGVDGRLRPERVPLDGGEAALGPPADTLLGPAPVAGEMRVFADGRWLAERGDEWVDLGADERRWTCLKSLGGQTYGCSLEGLFRFDGADRPAAEPVFRFVQIAPSECARCEPDWAHFGGESGWTDTLAATDPSGERQPIAGGCAAAGASGAAWALALALLTLRRRPRRRPAR